MKRRKGTVSKRRKKKAKPNDALVLTVLDITEISNVDIEEIEHKNPTRVKCIGYLHNEDRKFIRLKNFMDKDTADVLVIPKSLIVERKKIDIK